MLRWTLHSIWAFGALYVNKLAHTSRTDLLYDPAELEAQVVLLERVLIPNNGFTSSQILNPVTKHGPWCLIE